MSEAIGYEDDVCYFCKKKEAAYAREKNGKIYDACFACARKGPIPSKKTDEE